MNKKIDANLTKNFLTDIRQDSELLRLTSSYDWNSSPVGPVEFWPQSLKNAVSLILQNGMPMYLAWGKDFTQFYNDGYLPFLGASKHPNALGNTAKKTWPEIWDFLSPLWESVLATGQSVCGNDLKLSLERDGKLVESYFSYSCSAVCDDEGKIAGIFSVTTEITADVKLKQQLKSAQKESELERAKLHNFFMQAPTPICIFEGPTHRFVLTNPAHEKFSGRKIENGKTPLEVFSSLEASAFLLLLDEVYKTGVPHVGTHPVFLPDEKGLIQEHWINIGYHPYKNVDGKIQGVMAIVQDLTLEVQARKEAEEGKKNLQLALESAQMGTWKMNLQTSHTTFSKETMKLFSVDSQAGNASELINALVHPEDTAGLIEAIYKAISERKTYSHDYRIIRKDGQIRWFVAQGDAILEKDGSCNYYTGTVQDITDRVQAKIEFEKAKLEAEMANQTKSFFLANMSHEIRTPLGAILGFTELLKERNLGFEDRNQFLEIITRNGKSLTKIIDDILDLTKVESGNLEVENLEVSIFDLVDDAMDIFRESARAKGIFLRAHVAKDTPSKIRSDPTRIRQILINVVGNAIKFTELGGVTIDVRIGDSDGSKTQFIIAAKDSGIGISEDQAKRLFQPFTQADNSTNRKYGGTGLGLVISKRLAIALGGDVSIEDYSTPNGCTFIFTFSAIVSQNEENQKVAEKKITGSDTKSAEKKNQALQDLRILIADDSSDNRVLVQLILSKQGAMVEIAKNGLEAFSMGMNGTFDIILMDIQMPEMDGYEATRALREAGFKKPIIALSAHAMSEDRTKTIASGCNEHITKPINQVELCEAIGRHMKRI